MAKRKLAYLEYTFVFDPFQTWSSMRDFDDELGKYFKSIGCQAEVMDAMTGYSGKKLIYISTVKDLLDNPGKLKPIRK